MPDHFLVEAFSQLGNILGDGGVDNGEFLIHRTQELVILPAVEFPDVDAVEGHSALVGIVETAEELHQCGLTRTVQTHHRQLLAGADGETYMTENGFLCTGVAEGHILQLPFIGFGFRNGSAALEAEGLRVVQVFEDRANVTALVFRTGQVTQNTRHPLGKGGDGGQVQQKFRSAQVFLDRHGNQKDVGYRVSQNTCNPLDQIHFDICLFPMQNEVLHQPQSIIIDVLKPTGNTENTDILGKLNRTGFSVDIAKLLPVCTMFLPMLVVPLIRVPMAQEADRRSAQGNENQDDVHIGQHRQVHRKAQNIGHQARQRLPDMLRSLSIAAGGV